MTHKGYPCGAEHAHAGLAARRRDLAIAGTAFACLSSAFVVSPATAETGPVVCPFRLATGLPCPGCGLVRSWVALAHGDVQTALSRHAFGPLLFGLAVVGVIAVAYAFARRRAPFDLAARAASAPGIALATVWCGWWFAGLVA